jgi:hypothetical protein
MKPRLLVVALAFGFGLIACGNDEQPPSAPAAPSVFLGQPKSLQVTGELSFDVVGQARQLTATATFANGTTRNVTQQAEWSSSNPAVATVSKGYVRVVAFGEAQITAAYRGAASAAIALTAKALPVLSSITVTGPAEVAPGATGQYKATGNYVDGSTRDLTSTSTWTSFSNSVIRHIGSGQFQGVAGGETRVNATNSGKSSSIPVMVLPAGTYKLSGTVKDTIGGVEDVTVQVVSGTGTGLSARTQYGGGYRLYGVSGAVQLRASSPGYFSRDFSATVNGHTVQDVQIDPDGTSMDLAGDWTFSVGTSSACSNSWPAAARRREATAVIRQQATRLYVHFASPTMPDNYESTGRILGSQFSLTIYYDYYYGSHGFLDRVSQTEWVAAYGTITGQASQSTITGTFNGTIEYTAPGSFPRSCAADGPMELRRK